MVEIIIVHISNPLMGNIMKYRRPRSATTVIDRITRYRLKLIAYRGCRTAHQRRLCSDV